jgi:hypothetical protein
MSRYETGETLASIARTYDCSPPAISYVVSRSRARQPDAETAAKSPGGQEPQLIKAAAPDGAPAAFVTPTVTVASAEPPAPNGHSGPEAQIAPLDRHRDTPSQRESNGSGGAGGAAHWAEPSPSPVPDGGNGTPHFATTSNGEQRRTLHLSLGNPQHRNGEAHPADLSQADSRQPEIHSPEPRPLESRQVDPPAFSAQAPAPPAPTPHNGQNGAAPNELTGPRRTAYPEHLRRNEAETGPRKDAGTFIDHELRARVDGDIAVFLAAFDAALLNDTQESRSGLREATDRLLRAGARTRIELERLEARLPLPPRDNSRSGEAAWRHR